MGCPGVRQGRVPRQGWALPGCQSINSQQPQERQENKPRMQFPAPLPPGCSPLLISQKTEGKRGERDGWSCPGSDFPSGARTDPGSGSGETGRELENNRAGVVHPLGKVLDPFPWGMRNLGGFMESQGGEWGENPGGALSMEPKAKAATP